MNSLTIHQVAALVRGRRLRHGLSQTQVAASLGVSRRWVRDLEAGGGGAHLETVLRLLDLLGVELVVRGEGAVSPPDEGLLDTIIAEHLAPPA